VGCRPPALHPDLLAYRHLLVCGQTCAGGSGFGQQLLDDHFRLAVFAFAEMVMADTALRVGEVQGGPVAGAAS
jgi:hypothetical protein